MIASKWGDPVLGIDIHAVTLPPPAPPAPTPLPHPFIGVVFDPLGALVGALMGAVFGGGGPVYVNGMPCGNTGTEVKGIPHVPTPPGVAPHPVDAPTANEGSLISGSKTVLFAGSSESRTGSIVMSCSYPINLPGSVCLSVPMGPPVLIGGPEAVDWAAAVTLGIRTKWMSNKLHSLLGATKGSWRSKLICFLTGHPVDVMTGELLAEAVDFEIPGLIPVVWERNYRSRQTRQGALGSGWYHPFDELVEETERGLVLWLADGRPKQHPKLRAGGSDWDGEDRYWIRRVDGGYDVESWDGIRRSFRKVDGAKHFVLTGIDNRAGNLITLDYERGYLCRIRDTGGRELDVRWTREGRMEGIYFETQPLVRYTYDAEGRLARAIDPAGSALRYAYRGGVMVEEIHKGGLAFHFSWDWYHPEGWCTRTWGENPASAMQPGEPAGVPQHIYNRKITYDKHRHFTSVEDGRGGITQYWGNDLGLVEKLIDPGGAVTEYTWDALCRKTSETDGVSNKTEWTYDAQGNCIKERDALGAETHWTFDRENQLVRIVDPAGAESIIEWGRKGQPLWVCNPLGVMTIYTHDDHGRVLSVVDAMGRRIIMTWTSRHDLASYTDGENRTTNFEYDLLGRLTGSRDAGGRIERAVRDVMGRITYLECADGEKFWMEYDVEGNVIEQVDSLGRVTRMRYAGMSRLVEHINPMCYRVRLEYDSEEDLIAVENPLGERYRFELDRAGRVKHELGFDGRKQSYFFDKAGRTNRILGPDYHVTLVERDPLGRVIRRKCTAPSAYHAIGGAAVRGEEESFEFDACGALVAARTAATSIIFERDALGRTIKEHCQVGEISHFVASRYDLSSNRIERETDLGHRTEYIWDGAGDLAGVKAGASSKLLTAEVRALRLPLFMLSDWEMTIERDPFGLESSRRVPGGVVAIWKRDTFGRPALRQVLIGASPGRKAEDVSRVGYRWRAPEQIEAMIDTSRGATRFEHDSRGHLIAAMFPDGTTQHRASDAGGNLFRRTDCSDSDYGRGGTLQRSIGNRYRYDGQGNLIEKILVDGTSWKYSWSVTGRLIEVLRPDGKAIRFTYDALGRRTSKVFDGSITEYVWDGDDLVHERVKSTDGAFQPLVTWIFDPDSFAPVAKIEGRRRYAVITDHLGTPTMLLTEDGQLAWKAQLDIWGVVREEEAVREENRTSNSWRWPGQYEDAETGLYYNRFRYYDPETGRYISQDPAGLDGGLAQYAYVHDPLIWIDPLGLAKKKNCKKGGGDDDINRGPGGARKHNPGKAHRNATNNRKAKEKWQARAANKRAQAEERYRKALERWEKMSEAARKLLPELHPDKFKP
ncbi:RHS repeat-associated core domain-containing protein [Sorangium sp. KYC3313]|uniref:RHS repeat-associated core domain-containing protein n=1 Tax=Sorangium sp. KYC3313 TaxID=3449740 RepID=UPI003F8BF1E7